MEAYARKPNCQAIHTKVQKKKKIKERVEVIKEIERQFPTGETWVSRQNLKQHMKAHNCEVSEHWEKEEFKSFQRGLLAKMEV